VKREDWNRRYGEIESLWSLTPNRFLVAEAADLRPGRALDLACGEGRNAIWLAEQGWQVTAVDYSDVAIEKARRRAADEDVKVDFHVRDLLAFKPEHRAYELVVVLYLQLPAAERRHVLAMAADAVAHGGTLLLVGHDQLNATEGVGGPSDPDVLYTPDDIVAELPGLEIEKAERVLRDVDDSDRPAIDALVRAIRP
jgi:2-polyprenyl-3-methyl-5-hydroxy-6-metoxy-1,4-benzoquinol methylase